MLLYDFTNQNEIDQLNLLDIPGSRFPICSTKLEDNNNLVITIGESWTWGDSLPSDVRMDQVYGNLIAKELSADFINIGICGFNNNWMILQLEKLLDYIKENNHYQKVIFILTLTEHGRDFVDNRFWLSNYQELPSDISYDDILLTVENVLINRLKKIASQLPNNISVVLGQNFVWHNRIYQELKDTNLIVFDQTWIEKIAEYNKQDYPLRTNMVTNWIFTQFNGINHILDKDKTEYKEWCLDKLDDAIQVNEWLDNSPLNNKEASKHPNAIGHRVWADYIISWL